MRKPSYGSHRRDPTKAGARREYLEGRRPGAVDQEGPLPSVAMDPATTVPTFQLINEDTNREQM